jgi:hypothetical protein
MTASAQAEIPGHLIEVAPSFARGGSASLGLETAPHRLPEVESSIGILEELRQLLFQKLFEHLP